MLSLTHRDEVAHFGFFKRCLALYMDYDRDLVLVSLSVVVAQFHMPASQILPDWEEPDKVTKRWAIINDRIFLTKVVLPVMKHLGTDRAEMRIIRQQIMEREETVIPNATALQERALMLWTRLGRSSGKNSGVLGSRPSYTIFAPVHCSGPPLSAAP